MNALNAVWAFTDKVALRGCSAFLRIFRLIFLSVSAFGLSAHSCSQSRSEDRILSGELRAGVKVFPQLSAYFRLVHL